MVGDLSGNKEFSVIKPFAFWTQHVLPLVYGDEISYMETLDKVVKLLNELIKNNNKLPEYIQQIVEEYITGGPLEEVLRSILADFILNVKYPPSGITPAKGDGTANDYEAIQGCIDYAASKGGGVVYFPFGKYLTSKLTLKPNVSLMGFGKYCTSIVLTGGETDALLSGSVTDCGIYNITLDANMSIQVNDVDVLTLTGSNIQLMNVILTDGYSLFNIEKTGDNIELNNVEFRYAVESMLRIGGTVGTLNANSIKFGNLSTIKGVAAIISDSNNDVITGIVSNDILPLFAQLDGNNNVLKGVVASTNVIAGDGQNNVYDFYGKTKSETYTGDVSETVHGSKTTHIDVMSTWAVDGNSTESVDGTKSEIVTGVSSAQYNGDRTVNGKNFTETMSGKKVINAQDIVLNPTNPLTYKTPTVITPAFYGVPAKDNNGNVYNILVEGDLDSLPKGVVFDSDTKDKENTLYVDTVAGVINTPEPSFYEKAGMNNIQVRNTNHDKNVYRVLTLNCPMRRALGGFETPFSVDNIIRAQQYMVESGADFVCLEELAELYQYPVVGTLGNDYFPNVNMFDNVSVMTGNTVAEALQPWIYGNGIASQITRISTRGANYELLSDVEPRGWFNEKYSVNNKTVSVYVTHLGLTEQERASQVTQLATILQADSSNIVIVGADWNMDLISNPVLVKAITDLGFTIMNTSRLTYPNTNPSVGIDNILVKGATKVGDGVVVTEPDANDMFDHYGYWVDLQF